MPDRSRKRPRDVNELARRLVDEATGDAPPSDPDEGKDPAAVALGRKGGLKGGKARAAKMTAGKTAHASLVQWQYRCFVHIWSQFDSAGWLLKIQRTAQ